MDDPTASLDNVVAEQIIKQVTTGSFKNRTRIVVTHKKELVKLANRIYYIDANFEVKQADKEYVDKYFTNVSTYKSIDDATKAISEAEPKPELKPTKTLAKAKIKVESEDEESEDLEKLLPKDETLKSWIIEAKGISVKAFVKAVRDMKGIVTMPIIFTIALIASFTEPASIAFLLYWSQNFEESTKWRNLGYLSMLYTVKSFVPPIRRILCFVFFQYNLSLGLHARMLFKAMHASLLEFHDKLPPSFVINRFSNDVGKVDNKLVDNFGQLMNLVSIMIYQASMIIFTIHPISAFFVIFFIFVSVRLQRGFIGIRRSLIKNQSGSMTFVVDQLDDTLSDLCCIRVLGIEDYLFEKYRSLLTVNFYNSFMLGGFNVWFNAVMSMSSLLLVQVPCFLVLLYVFDPSDWNLIVVFIVLVGNLAGDLQRFLFFFTDLDGNFVDLDRCYFFEKIPYEKGLELKEEEIEAYHSGDVQKVRSYLQNHPIHAEFMKIVAIEFRDVHATYSTEAPNVLKGISCRIEAGQKVGVIGKTGSGKSSFVKLLWRYLIKTKGSILFNNKDIDKVELRALRRSVCVLSQESHILTGSVRMNVDPRGLHSDEEIMDTLREIGFDNPGYLEQGPSYELFETGKNISVGEKQLISLARVMLSKASLVILDEATASMDHEMEAKVNNKIAEKFRGKAIIIIVAHRVDAILDSDKIIAFSDGKIIEEGSPAVLLANHRSYLKRVVGESEKKADASPRKKE